MRASDRISDDAAISAKGLYPPSWYAATRAPAPDAPPLAGEAEAEICVIGGGYAGLSAALHLARAGRKVVLLEADRLGWGASGRNGGQVHVGMRREQEWLEKHLGADDAHALWRMALNARAHLDWLIADQGAACDFTPGYLHVDHRAGYVRHTHAHVDHLRERYGYEHVRAIDAEEARHLVGSAGYHGGMLDMRGGHLHALNFALGIARAAASAGAILHEHSPALSFARKGDRWRIETPRGRVTADRVLIACNGYLRGLAPQVEQRVMPINNYVAVTAPLGAERAAAIVRDGYAVSDSRFVVYYFRMTPDHRLLFGGGENYSWRFPADIPGFVRRHMLAVFPQLADVAIDHGWGGTLAITPNRLPFVREIEPGMTAIGGFSGLGVVMAPYVGKLVADAMTGDDADYARLARLPIPRFPGGRLMRWPTLVAAMSFLALRDRLY
ncbi:NAD(P)/FAD-dependent oxidoreductase [Sphingomonas abietis]|uniref:FAD-binding oxidoreductase n=1 Tax=Sphingomonas abietis TaxID=3012344 RepID=A0ABY7NKI9_9SPHN|nr:FAD-binding oxidoreductase [Sphingomonas abietis]WBO21112.1 FAD-binding oxidoreductase [Sphingomonas abietis]